MVRSLWRGPSFISATDPSPRGLAARPPRLGWTGWLQKLARERGFVKDEGRGKARAFASKQSRSAALQNAFSKLILIVLDNGKVTAEIDMNKTDPFAYNPIWDVPSIVVNEVNYEEPDQLNESDLKDRENL